MDSGGKWTHLTTLATGSGGVNTSADGDKVFFVGLIIILVAFICTGVNDSAEGDSINLGGLNSLTPALYTKAGASGDKDDFDTSHLIISDEDVVCTTFTLGFN